MHGTDALRRLARSLRNLELVADMDAANDQNASFFLDLAGHQTNELIRTIGGTR